MNDISRLLKELQTLVLGNVQNLAPMTYNSKGGGGGVLRFPKSGCDALSDVNVPFNTYVFRKSP